jgi:2-iminobutanoate/2-iminopropanoate deaminase
MEGTMNLEPLYTDKAPKPIGPYSQAVGAGQFVFISGQLALDPASGELVGSTVEEQTRRIMDNLQAILVAQKLTFSSLAKVTIFLNSMADFTVVNKVYEEYLGESKPARSVVQAARLPRGALIEIEGIAAR